MTDLTPEERAALRRRRERVGGIGDRAPEPPLDGTPSPLDPMLAATMEGTLADYPPADWIAEPKFDGTRLIVERLAGTVRAYTRRGIDRAAAIPGAVAEVASLDGDLILDGEYVFLDETGTSRFQPIHTGAERVRELGLRPRLVLFDLLYADGDLTAEPLVARRRRLADVLELDWPVDGGGTDPEPAGPGSDGAATERGADVAPAGRESPGALAVWGHDVPYEQLTIVPHVESGFERFFESLLARGEEGVILKRRGSRYYPGVRSRQWLKVKRAAERDVLVVGYTAGRGNRSGGIGSLVLTDGERCVGRVGSGLDAAELETLAETMTPVDRGPVSEAAAGGPYQPVAPFVVRVRYLETTGEGKLRAPVYVGRRPETPVDAVEPLPPVPDR